MISNRKRKYFFLLGLFVIAITFTVLSVLIISEVNADRKDVEQIVGSIGVVTEFEEKLQKCVELSAKNNADSFRESIKAVVETDFQIDKYPDLNVFKNRAKALRNFFDISGVQMDFEPFQDSLQALFNYSFELKKEKRKKLGVLSVQLGEYWAYSHALIIAACVLSFLLVVVGFFILKSRNQFETFRQRTSTFMNNVVDCIIITDKHGKFTEANDVAIKAFGYTLEEFKENEIAILYAEKEKALFVKEELERKGFFKGEIINVRKDGEHFVSFLSANSIFDDKGNLIGTMGISREITEQKKNEEEFQHIIGNAVDIIYTTDIEGNITYVNTSGKNILGYEENTMIGMSFKDFVHPDYLEEVEGLFEDQFKSRKSESYLELKIITQSGEEIWVGQNVKTSFSPIYPSMITGFFGIIRNLNSVKQAELDLKESEAKYRELFDNSTDIIQSVDPNGNILYVNDSWKSTLGYSDDEWMSMNFMDIMQPDSQEYCQELLADLLKIGVGNSEEEHLFKVIAKSGEEFILKGGVSLTSENGQVISLQTFLRNVTAEAKIEEALRKSEENFRLISRSISDVFFLFNVKEGKYEYISDNSKRQLGAPPSFFYDNEKGSYLSTFIHPDDREYVIEQNRKVDSGDPIDIEYRIIVNEKERWINEKAFPIKDEYGAVVVKSGVSRDITEMKNIYQTISEQNQEISQSILYAKNIQESTLPTPSEVKDLFPESFVFYQAKDVLSGDLYITDKVKDKKGTEYKVCIVGDCTGHGVPGGVLSLLCSSLLTESITSKDVNNPGQALDFVRSKLIRLFRSNPSKYILDGMDAAFCMLDEQNKLLRFAGANLSCYILRKGEVLEYKGDKQHIGYGQLMEPFKSQTIGLEQGDLIYLTTDGYVDQFGGPKTKKFLKKRLIDLLLDIADLPIEEQGNKIEENFKKWKGQNEQTDDIAMFGVRFFSDFK